MLLKLKKEQSLKLKISIIFIWLLAMIIILNTIYDSYLMYVDEYEYHAFSTLPKYTLYIAMAFGVLVAIGLLIGSKVSRYLILLISYVSLFAAFYTLVKYSIGLEDYILIFSISYHIVNIYLLSHEDILKVFKIKHLKWEIVAYIFLSVVFYIFFIFYIKGMTDDFDNEVLFEPNTSIEVEGQ